MKTAALLAAALVLMGCAYLPRSPYCDGAKSYRGMAKRTLKSMPTALRDDSHIPVGSNIQVWYESTDAAVVIAVVPGEGDRAFSYRRNAGAFAFEGVEGVPCLLE
jgi:hypothetical protein